MKIKNEKGSVISRIFKDNKYCWLAFGCSAVIMLRSHSSRRHLSMKNH